ncbi:MAG: hypothetical protein HGA97_01155 [Chlorobiaceae bacterium]|nr:hypothetical protein [Chlorobiaceae bacterium]
MKDDEIVVDRQHRNVDRYDLDISRGKVWKTHIGCLLTSQQKSSVGSPIQRFLDSSSQLLSIGHCDSLNDLKEFAFKELKESPGIRFTDKISEHINTNHDRLSKGRWSELLDILHPFVLTPCSKEEERAAAERIPDILKGFWPKQSRNFLQWLGLTQYEIPIDSRIIKWLKETGNSTTKALLPPAAFSDKDYYCCILDAIQGLCRDAQVLPCMFDAAVFASIKNP